MKKDLGIKVIINTKEDNGQAVCGFGYIMRRINANIYEVWSESLQTVLILNTDDFIEIN